jgi:hypothetical protein
MSLLAKKQEIPTVLMHKDLVEVSQRQIAKSPSVETGGKFLGFIITAGSQPPKSSYGMHIAAKWRQLSSEGTYLLLVGSISPGPRARQTATELLPDGEFQNAVFRSVELKEPTIEHLGSWHSHHPNGLSRFSSGDISHYRSVVADKNYGPHFFVAGLCINTSGLAGGSVEIFGKAGGLHAPLGKDRLAVVSGFPSLQPTIVQAEQSIAVGIANTAGNSAVGIANTAGNSMEVMLKKYFTVRSREVDADSISWVIADRAGKEFMGVLTQGRGQTAPAAVSIDVTGHGCSLHYDGPISSDVKKMTSKLLGVLRNLEDAESVSKRRK